MKTIELNIEEEEKKALECAQKIFFAGGVFVYPTDTVYGLGANPFNEEASAKITKIKQRDERKKYILLIDDINTLLKYIEVQDEHHIDFLISLWPNPVSVVLKLKKDAAKIFGNPTAAFRIPNHHFCRKLIKHLKMPLISTSVNRSGEEPMNDFDMISQEFRNEVDAILYNSKHQISTYSTVIELTADVPVLLREGKIKFHDIQNKFVLNNKQYSSIKK